MVDEADDVPPPADEEEEEEGWIVVAVGMVKGAVVGWFSVIDILGAARFIFTDAPPDNNGIVVDPNNNE